VIKFPGINRLKNIHNALVEGRDLLQIFCVSQPSFNTMTAAAFESFVPSETSWTLGRPSEIADDTSSCGSVETSSSLGMSFVSHHPS
jgi:hypothetical protein